MRRAFLPAVLVLAACGSGDGSDGQRASAETSAASDPGSPVVVTNATRTPCDSAPASATTYVHMEKGRLKFDVSPDWRVSDGDAVSSTFRIPAIEQPGGGPRAEVLVAMLPMGPATNLGATTDSLLAPITAGSLRAVLADTMPDADHRFFWWNGVSNGASYSIFNDFGQAGGPIAHVLISVPLLEGTPRAALEALSRDTDRLLSSLTVDGRRVFPGWTMHPSLECYAPDSASR